jgi:PKD repeat protein
MSHAYMAPGSYRVTLTVRDATGSASSDSSQVDVTARVSSSVLNLVLVSNAVAGQPVLFAALPLEENASALSYVWTFSDGQSAIGLRAVATFPVAGMYLISVTVTNDLGAITVAQIAFHVVDAAY